ncbi:alkylphosphonate transporter [Mycolicibacterium pyrenivorans]|uniref:alkylphosphonate transporter n=1 Tax=Mycolicibacterium pyrenivorans TaxID=187102 RepID=UPI0021F270DD|nr:alkylphosphonate transporter [Mycolicibacterium pyrenivorans]
MADEGSTSLVDFRFARHPKCPRCRVSRTKKAVYGHLSEPLRVPWLDYRGCVRTDQHAWTCGVCGLQWW